MTKQGQQALELLRRAKYQRRTTRAELIMHAIFEKGQADLKREAKTLKEIFKK